LKDTGLDHPLAEVEDVPRQPVSNAQPHITTSNSDKDFNFIAFSLRVRRDLKLMYRIITALIKWMTSGKPLYASPNAASNPITFNSFKSILRACRNETATVGPYLRYGLLITGY
jgi:hypothetical protein